MRTRREQETDERRKTFWAIVASVLFHLLIILLVALILERSYVPPPPPPDETPVELTMVEPEPTPTPPPLKPSYIETTDSQLADKPPEHPAFESDKDTHAASQAPARGAEPLPSQEGEKSPAISFENKDYTAGPTPRPSTPVSPPQQQTPPAPEPVPTPEPQPTPEATPSATPPPPHTISDIALLEPPKPRNTPRPEMQKSVPRPPAPPPQPPGYQPQTQVTRIQGGISTRGRSAVDAIGTPMGRYKKSMSDAIGSRWYYYVNEHRDMVQGGTVDVRFIVKADGKVEKIKVLRNSSNGITENFSVGAVQDAEIPPIPKELVPQLQNGSIEVEFSFTILAD